MHDPFLVKAVNKLGDKIHECTLLILNELSASKPHDGLATKKDLDDWGHKIMAKIDDLVAAATALSTASDGVSVKLDNLITKVDAVVASLQNADLTPAQEAALEALKTSAATAASEGDKVDAEVAKLDTLLPTPAPAAPPSA